MLKIGDMGFFQPASTSSGKIEIEAAKSLSPSQGMISSAAEVTLDADVKKALFDILFTIKSRESTLIDLAPEVGDEIREVLKQGFSARKLFAQGMATALKAQQQITSQIAAVLYDAHKGGQRTLLEDPLDSAAKRLLESITVPEFPVGNEKAQDRMTLTLALPLYPDDASVPYPAYIHIYHEKRNNKDSPKGNGIYQTWLRICLITENLGRVDLLFRIDNRNNLAVRVHFYNAEAALLFQTVFQELKEKITGQPLKLAELAVTTASG